MAQTASVVTPERFASGMTFQQYLTFDYVEFPTIYDKDRIVGRIRAARPGESAEETRRRGTADFFEFQKSPFFEVYAGAGVDEIISALYARLFVGPLEGSRA
jgi:hypothetical protein